MIKKVIIIISNNNNNNNDNNDINIISKGSIINNLTHLHPTVTTKFLKQTISKLNMIP